ncbi:hypothetical protein RJT34_08347 [Clitoria ternatea]|uniref:Retrotransposon Copia-like N-terminal domain-containing protein n=1 Tax=Clitoria ternatea TaxID=43366 RepID=A0AAN9K6X2_CLITE
METMATSFQKNAVSSPCSVKLDRDNYLLWKSLVLPLTKGSKMKTLADNLKLAGSPVSTSDLIIRTLAGLDSEYNPIVVQLSDKDNMTWVDLQAQLLTFENRLEQLNSFSNLTINASANAVTRSNHKSFRQ